MAKYLVTGATGFLGNAIARQLQSAGHEIRVLARPNSNKANLSDMDVEYVAGDLADPASTIGAAKGCDGVFHAAADYRLWVPKPEAMYRANIDGSQALIRSALDDGVSRVVYTSSVAALKVDNTQNAVDETARAQLSDMIGHYKRSKFLAERMVEKEVAEGAAIVIASPTAPIGPRDIKPTPTGKIIVDAANGKMPAYIATGLNVAHVDDVAAGHILALNKGRIGENYIFGGQNLSLKDILCDVARIMGTKPPSIELSSTLVKPIAFISECIARMFNTEAMVPMDGVKMAEKTMFFSHAKATQELGYQAQKSDQAIEDAIDWFIANGYIKKPKASTR